MQNKKLLIILIVSALSLIGGGAFYFLNSSSSLEKEESFESPYEEELNSLLEDNFERIKEDVGVIRSNWDELTPLKEFTVLEKSDCEKLEGNLKVNCEEEILYYEILENNDLNACESLSRFRDECFYELSRTGSLDGCLKISDLSKQEKCFSDLAHFSNDVSFCDLIEDDHERVECGDRFFAMANGGIQEFQPKGDIAACKGIKTLEYFNQCILRSEAECEKLEDKELVDRCHSFRNFSTVLDSTDISSCSLLPDPIYNRVCNVYFENNRTMIDSDGDGIKDDRELWFAMDPFLFNDNAAKYLPLEGESSFIDRDLLGSKDFSLKDSDNDGLSDLEETEKYGTDFQNPDTDGDGFSDGEEVSNGFDPLN